MLEVDLNALDAALAAGEPLIDVRETDEFEQVRVPGAVLVPLSEFVSRVNEIPDAETVYVICAVGGRSLQAAEYLQARGINAVSVAGGTMGWFQSGRKVDTGPVQS
ncbi:rhodanese-related sulfurtransferase [Rhodococcus sp. 27YEA15]|uniref:rhodanese-like domain-containing protein n=1 Tax=Rhodococcus sp. 27YEA15 TaxID=3156259 RepID=UPI003C79BA5C